MQQAAMANEVNFVEIEEKGILTRMIQNNFFQKKTIGVTTCNIVGALYWRYMNRVLQRKKIREIREIRVSPSMMKQYCNEEK